MGIEFIGGIVCKECGRIADPDLENYFIAAANNNDWDMESNISSVPFDSDDEIIFLDSDIDGDADDEADGDESAPMDLQPTCVEAGVIDVASTSESDKTIQLDLSFIRDGKVESSDIIDLTNDKCEVVVIPDDDDCEVVVIPDDDCEVVVIRDDDDMIIYID